MIQDFCDLTEPQQIEVLSWRNHPDVRKWQFNGDPIELEPHLSFVRSLMHRRSSDRYWRIGDTGVVYLNRISEVHQHAYLGMYANPFKAERGRGDALMGELCRQGFDELKLHSIRLEVFENNERAFRLYGRHGFKEEGRLASHIYFDGKWVSLIVMGRLSEP